jgi:hypothetical protein
MTQSDTPARLDPAQELEALHHALQTSAQVVRSGGVIDLGGLDAQVEQLCAEVVKTEGPVRLALLPKLEEIIKILDWLEAELRVTSSPEGEIAHNRIRARQAYPAPVSGAPPNFKSVTRTH